MINEIIYWELYALVVSFFNGVLLAWIYDNIRAFRRIVRHKTVVFMSVEDIIYGIYAASVPCNTKFSFAERIN